MSASDLAISVRGISKAYVIHHNRERHNTLAETVLNRLRNPFVRSERETFWALKDVSFDVNKGEIIGIIGRNGAGKSTLLKIMSRITEPTGGEIDLFGRIGSLLEVGTGFHPELTGRENIYLNGQILGMRKKEIDRHFDAIVDFAEVEKFIDTPVKRYSSGMYVRLAFAVAAHLESDILIVDEVLAVGDSQFQKKCVGKMGAVAGAGRTVLFVTHNMTAVQGLCHRVIWLEDGQKHQEGSPRQVISDYLGYRRHSKSSSSWIDPQSAPGNHQVRLLRVDLHPKMPVPHDALFMQTPLAFDIEFEVLVPSIELDITIFLENEEGIIVLGTSTAETPGHQRPTRRGCYKSTCDIPGNLLNAGHYGIRLLVVQNQAEVLFTLNTAVSFEIADSRQAHMTYFSKRAGVVRPMLPWTTHQLELAETEGPIASVTRDES